MKVVISVGHWGKTKKLTDRGGVNLEGDTEAYISFLISYYLAINLEKAGHLAFILSYENSKHRQLWANKIGSHLFYEMHLNLENRKKLPVPEWTEADYGLVLYDFRKPYLKEFASILSKSLETLLGWQFRLLELTPDKRGFNSIKYVKRGAFILELGFLNNPKHIKTIKEKTKEIGMVISNTTISSYFSSLKKGG